MVKYIKKFIFAILTINGAVPKEWTALLPLQKWNTEHQRVYIGKKIGKHF